MSLEPPQASLVPGEDTNLGLSVWAQSQCAKLESTLSLPSLENVITESPSPPRPLLVDALTACRADWGQLRVRASAFLRVYGLRAKIKVDTVACPIAPSSRPQPLTRAVLHLPRWLPGSPGPKACTRGPKALRLRDRGLQGGVGRWPSLSTAGSGLQPGN